MWALVGTAPWLPSSGGGRTFVHGCGSVHVVVELRKDVSDLHHLAGHYRCGWPLQLSNVPQGTLY